MNERINTGLSPEEHEERKRREGIIKQAASTLGITVEEVQERMLEILRGKGDIQELADHFAMHPEQLESSKTPREVGPEIAELEEMISSFESKYPLAELRAIVELSPDLATSFQYADDLASPERIEKAIQTYEKHNPAYVDEYKRKIAAARALVLTPEDARRFKIRTAAKKDLTPIVASLNNLKGNKDYEKLRARYLLLSNAVGKISGNKVNHD